MLHFLQSLSIGAGAGIVALVSALLAVLWARFAPRILVWFLPRGTPFIIARSLYWLPVWMGSDDVDQYGAWQWIAIVPWYCAGSVASSVVVLLFQRVRKSRTSN